MFRFCASALLVCVLSAGFVQAQKGAAPQTTSVQAAIKKVDAAAGILTLTVAGGKGGGAAKDLEFKIGDATKITVIVGEDKKELAGKDGLKNDQFKEGVKVTVVKDKDDMVVEVRVGNPPAKPKKK